VGGFLYTAQGRLADRHAGRIATATTTTYKTKTKQLISVEAVPQIFFVLLRMLKTLKKKTGVI